MVLPQFYLYWQRPHYQKQVNNENWLLHKPKALEMRIEQAISSKLCVYQDGMHAWY